MKESFRKIDAHGHLGPSYLGPESNINVYLHEAKKIGVVAAIASPGPTPEIIDGDRIHRPCLWSVNEGERSYFQETLKNGEVMKREPAVANPYHHVNIDLFNKAQKENKDITLYVMPIHHPLLDSSSEVHSMVYDYPSIALKLHGISTFTGPEDVSSHTIDALRATHKPLIVHTDAYTAEGKSHIHDAYRLNDPLKWVAWARETGVKTLITHGARLSPEALELATRTPNVMVGLAPDLLLMSEPERLMVSTDNYLRTLFSMVPYSKLLFDIDFGWNVTERNAWEKLDWLMGDRTADEAFKSGLIPAQVSDVFYYNAVKFYNI